MGVVFGTFNRDGRPICPQRTESGAGPLHSWDVVKPRVWNGGDVFFGQAAFATGHAMAKHGRQTGVEHGGVVFCGRLDNKRELCDRLNIDRSTNPSDNEIVLGAYLKWGEDCPSQMIGDWSFALWDARKEQLFLARDQFGHCGLYYYSDERTFVFSSSLNSILDHPDVPIAISYVGIATLARGFSREDETAFKNIFRLPVARSVRVTRNDTKVSRYWSPADVPEVRFNTDEEYVGAFRDVYTEAVRCRLAGGADVASTLSGGLDSSSTAALAAGQLKNEGLRYTAFCSVPQFICDRADDEYHFGDERLLVEELRRTCTNLDVDFVAAEDVNPLSSVRQLVKHCGHPFMSSSNLYWLHEIMKRAASKGFRRLLTGHGGNFTVSASGNRDEYLSQILRHGQMVSWIKEMRAFHDHGAGWASLLSRSLLPARFFRLRERSASIRKGSMFRSDFLEAMRRSGVSKDSRQSQGKLDSRVRKLVAMMRTDPNVGWRELAAASGIEVATPALDIRVVEFCVGVPQEQLTRHGQRKLLIRRAMKDLIPPKLLWNEKRGRQAGDLIYRIRAHRDDFESVIAGLKTSNSVTEILDLSLMRSVFDKLQSDVTPQLSQQAANILMNGLMVGLFLQQCESAERSAKRSAA